MWATRTGRRTALYREKGLLASALVVSRGARWTLLIISVLTVIISIEIVATHMQRLPNGPEDERNATWFLLGLMGVVWGLIFFLWWIIAVYRAFMVRFIDRAK